MTHIKLVSRSVVVVMLLVAVFTSGCVSNGAGKSDLERIERLKQENALLKRQISLMRRQLQLTASQRQSIIRPRVSVVRFGTNPVSGNADATVALIEFSDYFCPYCRRFHGSTLEVIRKNYIDKGKLLYIYRDYPRGMAKKAVDAAIAVNCAGQQGAYWKMQEILYRYSPAINRAFYKSTAIKLGLDAQKYEACLHSDQQRSAVKRDFTYGRSLGIRGTPTFYVGPVMGNKITAATTIVGAQPYSKFSQAIERLLRPSEQP
ncbi:MAG: thioredoxin domain-containing protein [Acidiferrobacterales bacterium]